MRALERSVLRSSLLLAMALPAAAQAPGYEWYTGCDGAMTSIPVQYQGAGLLLHPSIRTVSNSTPHSALVRLVVTANSFAMVVNDSITDVLSGPNLDAFSSVQNCALWETPGSSTASVALASVQVYASSWSPRSWTAQKTCLWLSSSFGSSSAASPTSGMTVYGTSFAVSFADPSLVRGGGCNATTCLLPACVNATGQPAGSPLPFIAVQSWTPLALSSPPAPMCGTRTPNWIPTSIQGFAFVNASATTVPGWPGGAPSGPFFFGFDSGGMYMSVPPSSSVPLLSGSPGGVGSGGASSMTGVVSGVTGNTFRLCAITLATAASSVGSAGGAPPSGTLQVTMGSINPVTPYRRCMWVYPTNGTGVVIVVELLRPYASTLYAPIGTCPTAWPSLTSCVAAPLSLVHGGPTLTNCTIYANWTFNAASGAAVFTPMPTQSVFPTSSVSPTSSGAAAGGNFSTPSVTRTPSSSLVAGSTSTSSASASPSPVYTSPSVSPTAVPAGEVASTLAGCPDMPGTVLPPTLRGSWTYATPAFGGWSPANSSVGFPPTYTGFVVSSAAITRIYYATMPDGSRGPVAQYTQSCIDALTPGDDNISTVLTTYAVGNNAAIGPAYLSTSCLRLASNFSLAPGVTAPLAFMSYGLPTLVLATFPYAMSTWPVCPPNVPSSYGGSPVYTPVGYPGSTDGFRASGLDPASFPLCALNAIPAAVQAYAPAPNYGPSALSGTDANSLWQYWPKHPRIGSTTMARTCAVAASQTPSDPSAGPLPPGAWELRYGTPPSALAFNAISTCMWLLIERNPAGTPLNVGTYVVGNSNNNNNPPSGNGCPRSWPVNCSATIALTAPAYLNPNCTFVGNVTTGGSVAAVMPTPTPLPPASPSPAPTGNRVAAAFQGCVPSGGNINASSFDASLRGVGMYTLNPVNAPVTQAMSIVITSSSVSFVNYMTAVTGPLGGSSSSSSSGGGSSGGGGGGGSSSSSSSLTAQYSNLLPPTTPTSSVVTVCPTRVRQVGVDTSGSGGGAVTTWVAEMHEVDLVAPGIWNTTVRCLWLRANPSAPIVNFTVTLGGFVTSSSPLASTAAFPACDISNSSAAPLPAAADYAGAASWAPAAPAGADFPASLLAPCDYNAVPSDLQVVQALPASAAFPAGYALGVDASSVFWSRTSGVSTGSSVSKRLCLRAADPLLNAGVPGLGIPPLAYTLRLGRGDACVSLARDDSSGSPVVRMLTFPVVGTPVSSFLTFNNTLSGNGLFGTGIDEAPLGVCPPPAGFIAPSPCPALSDVLAGSLTSSVGVLVNAGCVTLAGQYLAVRVPVGQPTALFPSPTATFTPGSGGSGGGSATATLSATAAPSNGTSAAATVSASAPPPTPTVTASLTPSHSTGASASVTGSPSPSAAPTLSASASASVGGIGASPSALPTRSSSSAGNGTSSTNGTASSAVTPSHSPNHSPSNGNSSASSSGTPSAVAPSPLASASRTPGGGGASASPSSSSMGGGSASAAVTPSPSSGGASASGTGRPASSGTTSDLTLTSSVSPSPTGSSNGGGSSGTSTPSGTALPSPSTSASPLPSLAASLPIAVWSFFLPGGNASLFLGFNYSGSALPAIVTTAFASGLNTAPSDVEFISVRDDACSGTLSGSGGSGSSSSPPASGCTPGVVVTLYFNATAVVAGVTAELSAIGTSLPSSASGLDPVAFTLQSLYSIITTPDAWQSIALQVNLAWGAATGQNALSIAAGEAQVSGVGGFAGAQPPSGGSSGGLSNGAVAATAAVAAVVGLLLLILAVLAVLRSKGYVLGAGHGGSGGGGWNVFAPRPLSASRKHAADTSNGIYGGGGGGGAVTAGAAASVGRGRTGARAEFQPNPLAAVVVATPRSASRPRSTMGSVLSSSGGSGGNGGGSASSSWRNINSASSRSPVGSRRSLHSHQPGDEASLLASYNTAKTLHHGGGSVRDVLGHGSHRPKYSVPM